jgi:formate hydrogenlyase subunit 4
MTGHQFRVWTALWALNTLLFVALFIGWLVAASVAEATHSRGWEVALTIAFWVTVIAALRGRLPKLRIRRR